MQMCPEGFRIKFQDLKLRNNLDSSFPHHAILKPCSQNVEKVCQNFQKILNMYKILWFQITLQDIIDFEKQYKGSEEEKQDLTKLYLLHEGDMGRIMESALCSSHDDEPRMRDILQQAVDVKDVPAYRAFTHESTKKKATRRRRVSGLFGHLSHHLELWLCVTMSLVYVLQAEKEQQEAEELKREMGLSTENSLVAMIQVK